MPEQDNTPSVFRWVAFIAVFVAAFAMMQYVVSALFTALWYTALAVGAGYIAVRVVKKLQP